MKICSISKKEFIDIVLRDDINFIACAITPWHAIGVNALLKRLQDKGVKINPLFIVIQSPNKEYLLGVSSFNFETEHVYSIDYSKKNSSKFNHITGPLHSVINFLKNSKLSKHQSEIYIANPWYPDFTRANWILEYNKNLKIKYCVFDEGVATYIPSSEPVLKAFKATKSYVKAFLFIYSFYIQNKFLYALIKKSSNFMNMNLFIKSNKALILNEVAIKYYRKILNRSISPNTNIDNFSSTVLIGTMAFPRNCIYNNEDLIFLKKLVGHIKAQGYTPVIKPHPRENDSLTHYADLNCRILDRSTALEMLFNSKFKPKAFISFSSTSLINAKLFYDINCMSIINLLNLENFHKTYKDEMTSFKKVFTDKIFFPNSINEIHI